MKRALSRALLLAALTALAALPARALPPPHEKWFRIRTPGFTVYSNASENAALRIAKNLVEFRALLPRVTRSLKLDSPAPVSVYVFASNASFGPYKRDESLAVSVSHLEGTYIALSAFPASGPPGKIRRSYVRYPLKDLYHEYTHFLLHNNFSNPPLWLNEGLAELYTTVSFYRHRAEVGRVLSEYVGMLRIEPWFSLRDLVVAPASPQDRRERGIFLAQSWALVHYLAWNGPEARERLDRALELADSGYAPSEIFDAVFAPDAADLERKLRDWVAKRSFRFVEIDTSAVEPPSLSVEPMSRAETLARLGDLLVHHTDRAVEAEEHFRAALAEEPAYVAAWKGLGTALQSQGRSSDARDAFRRAVDLDPSDPHARTLLAGSLLSEIARGADEARCAEILRSAREIYRAALALDPDSLEALAGLGTTWVLDAQPSPEGVAALEHARDLPPEQLDVEIGLMVLLLRAGDTARAAEVAADSLRSAADPLLHHLATSAGALAAPGGPAGIGSERRREILRGVVDLVEASVPAAIPEDSRRAHILARLNGIRLAVTPASQAAPRSPPPAGTP